jgi:hypothetical protein
LSRTKSENARLATCLCLTRTRKEGSGSCSTYSARCSRSEW